jgi:transposase-like protein
VKLVVADDHKGLRAAAAKVFSATHQRCRVHWLRNTLAHVPAKQRPAAVAMLKTIFAQDSAEAAHAQWRQVTDALRERFPKPAQLMDGAREDVLAYMTFPREHWPQIASTNPLERLNGEIKRRADVVGLRGLTRPSATVLLAPQRPRRRPTGGGPDARAERRVGGQPPLHEPGNARGPER